MKKIKRLVHVRTKYNHFSQHCFFKLRPRNGVLQYGNTNNPSILFYWRIFPSGNQHYVAGYVYLLYILHWTNIYIVQTTVLTFYCIYFFWDLWKKKGKQMFIWPGLKKWNKTFVFPKEYKKLSKEHFKSIYSRRKFCDSCLIVYSTTMQHLTRVSID